MARRVCVASAAAWIVVAFGVAGGAEELPTRVRRIVLHTPGGPSYERPERGFVFYAPERTQALWRRKFGTHWILWTDGSLWPRHPARGEPLAWTLPVDAPADHTWRARLARQAAKVYFHVYGNNQDSVGIEVAHSERSDDPFPKEQVRALAWLLRTLLDISGGRLGPESIVGHKDLDRRPAYVRERCSRPGCAFFADADGQPFHRRVDPPEGVFTVLQAEGLTIPRPAGTDASLRRAESMTVRPRPRAAW